MSLDVQIKFRVPEEWKKRLEQMGEPEGLKAAAMCRRAIKNFLSPDRHKLAQNDAAMPTLQLDAVLTIRISKAQMDVLKGRGNGEHGDVSNMARMAVWEFITSGNGQEPKSARPSSPQDPSDDLTLRFPSEIATKIGLHAGQINALKNKGCRFFGKKTTVKWVRDFIDQATET